MSYLKDNLKLFVWDGADTLQDYGSAMICVLAPDLETALELIKDKCKHCELLIDRFNLLNYRIITEPEVFICWSGE